MNFAKTSVFALCFAPLALRAADDFSMAAQVLAAARAGNARQVQILVNSGANVNFVDARCKYCNLMLQILPLVIPK